MAKTRLKVTRVAVSAVLFTVVTASLAGISTLLPQVARWVEEVQIVGAVLGFSLFTFVAWLLATLIFGRIYCSSVCPLGTLQDIFSRLWRITPRLERLRHYAYRRPLYKLQYVVLVTAVVALMMGFTAITELLDPYTVYVDIVKKNAVPAWMACSTGKIVVASVAGSAVAFIVFAIVAVASAKSGRVLCNSICPVGTTLGFVSRYSVFQIDIDTDKCIHCGRCEAACKASCINLRDNIVDGTRCVDCFDCLAVCPTDAIRYTSDRKQLSDVLMQRIGKPDEAATSTSVDAMSRNMNSAKQSDNETIS